MTNANFIPFWDERKIFYRLLQDGKNFCIQENETCVFKGRLIKLTDIEEYPVRPLIAGGKIFLYNYDRGLEVHPLNGAEPKFIDVRAVWQATPAEDLLFLQKRTDLVTVDSKSAEIIEKVHVSESFDIVRSTGCLLFYRLKRNKTYLYDIKTKQYTELPGFNAKFEIITQAIKKGSDLIVFYAAAKELENPIGVYIYDIEKKKGSFYCALSKFSANGNKFLHLIDFSFHDLGGTTGAIKNDGKNHMEYLQFILERFGFYAFLYYTDNKKLGQIENSDKREAIGTIVEKFSRKMAKYPSSNKEFALLLSDMEKAERQLKNILTHGD